jgi:hypothetical protein
VKKKKVLKDSMPQVFLLLTKVILAPIMDR